MADEPDNLVLHLLRRLNQRTEPISEDLREVSIRFAHVEENRVGVNRRLDRLDQRVDRIEKRLELADNSYGGVRE